MAKPKGLGRGLDALLSGNAESQVSQDQLRMLPIDALQAGKYQPRSHMDQDALAQLAESIQAQGVMQPILVRRLSSTEKYEIIAGERRWRASRLAGKSEVPVLIRDIPDESALVMALIENIQRENLNPIEEANGIQRLIDEFEMTHEAAAKVVGRSRSAVSNLLRLLQLHQDVQEMLFEARLDMGHARALLTLPVSTQSAAARQIADKQLSVRESELLVKKLVSGTASVIKSKDQDILRLEQELADILGTDVNISSSAKGEGALKIRYSSLEQLDAILARLR